MVAAPSSPYSAQKGSAREVLLAFLRLGCLSFGGPIAHLGYFHTEFVKRRKWCDEGTFAELVALAQSMPGPASSQVVFSLGLLRAGWTGGMAAWTGFTMPSALLMLAFAFGHKFLTGRLGFGIVHGLQLVAVAVVGQAILSMRKSLAPDVPRTLLALAAAAIVLFAPPASATMLAIAAGAILGWLLPRSVREQPTCELHFGIPRAAGVLAAVSFVLLLILLPILSALTSSHSISVFSAFYRTGALVFGGGHVVLPLLENAIVARGWVDQQSFLSGYGAAQALPGPLFTFAVYLGAAIRPSFNPVLLAGLSLVAIFLPGLLIFVAVLPFWSNLRRWQPIQFSLRGINAAVVGVLIAAFIHPVWSSAVHSGFDLVLAALAFGLLVRLKTPSWVIVAGVASVSAIASVFWNLG
jgi:chromate transporter